jgi:hypothetical protein
MAKAGISGSCAPAATLRPLWSFKFNVHVKGAINTVWSKGRTAMRQLGWTANSILLEQKDVRSNKRVAPWSVRQKAAFLILSSLALWALIVLVIVCVSEQGR